MKTKKQQIQKSLSAAEMRAIIQDRNRTIERLRQENVALLKLNAQQEQRWQERYSTLASIAQDQQNRLSTSIQVPMVKV